MFNIANGDVAGLRAAIVEANSNGEDDAIELAAGGIYTIADADHGLLGLPVMAPDGGHRLMIYGNGATVQCSMDKGAPPLGVFDVNAGADVTIVALTIQKSSTTAGFCSAGGTLKVQGCLFANNDGEDAGALLNSGSLTVTGSVFTENSGVFGGAIGNFGNAYVVGSTFSNNMAADGGAICLTASHSDSSLVVRDCMFTGNSAPTDLGGGAIFSEADHATASLEITSCTFDGNSAVGGDGGAICFRAYDFSFTLATVSSCTFAVNLASQGGAIFNLSEGSDGFSDVRIMNTTFKGNSASGAGKTIYNEADNLTAMKVGNSILSGSVLGGVLWGRTTSLGHNVCTDDGSGYLTAPGDQPNTDPLLDAAGLQNNGGPTKTIALLSNSPAINHGNDATAPSRDQRSYLRNGVSDIGAFEYGGTLAPVGAVSRKTHAAAGTFDVDLPLGGVSGVECRSGSLSTEHQIVATFATPVSAVGASVTSGTGDANVVSVNGSQVTINLTGVLNAQQIILTLSGVSDGVNTNDVTIPMRILQGDTNGDGTVNSADISQTKSKSGQTVDATNFREDLNLDGSINSADISLVKSKSGTGFLSSLFERAR